MLQTRLCVCKTLAPEVHQNGCSYVCELSGLTFDSLHKDLSMVGCYTDNPKNHKTVKIGGWTLAWDNMV